MCAGAKGKIKDTDVQFYGGYYGGSFTLGDKKFKPFEVDQTKYITLEKMADELCKYKKRDIVIMFLQLIKDSDE